MRYTLVIAFLFLLLPDTTFAQGFVQCAGPDCTFCSLMDTLNAVLAFIIQIAIIGCVIIIAWAGLKMVVSRGNPGAWKAAKESMMNVIIGIVIILLAFTLVDVLLKITIGGDFGVWNEIQTDDCGNQNLAGEVESDIELSETPIDPLIAGGGDSVVVGGAGYDTLGGGMTGAYNNNYNADGANLGVVTNQSMGPIFDPQLGGSDLVRDGAAERMQATLAGPFARLQQGFGRSIVINDAIAKAGTSRERETTGSRHFYGDALDLSTAGMSDADKIRLFEEAKRAGFTGFGFGRTILHVDLGPSRAWDYGNSTYGGVSVEQLKAAARR